MAAFPAKKADRIYTYADYLTWSDDERWELIDGVAYAMVPAPSIEHQRISRKILEQLVLQLPEEGPCEAFYSPVDVLLPEQNETDEEAKTVVQPDLLVVCDQSKILGRICRGAPTFVVEILSPSTAAKDRREKLEIYERHGVKEYWIVDPQNFTITIRVLENGKYPAPTILDEGIVEVTSLPGVTIDTSKFFPPHGERR